MLSSNEQFQLRKILENSKVDDHTDAIRTNKHSAEIRRCIEHIVAMKGEFPGLYREDKKQFEDLVLKEAGFLFFNYMSIYNLVLKDVDVAVLHRLLDMLKLIEDEKCDQHEASVLVGKLLKEMYVDTMLKDIQDRDDKEAPAEHLDISWAEYKTLNRT